MGRRIDLTGQRYGRLFVQSLQPRQEWRGLHAEWLCVCDCGNTSVVRSSDLRNGVTVSCGCHRKQKASQRLRTHGKSRTAEFGIWLGMKERCYRQSSPHYERYGARGIRICDRWRHDFAAFIADMGERPSIRHSIDRIDTNGDYSPENCRWATPLQQARNRRSNARLVFNGKTMCLTEAAEASGLKISTLKNRWTNGWDPGDMFLPYKSRRQPARVVAASAEVPHA